VLVSILNALDSQENDVAKQAPITAMTSWPVNVS
jgi:hypothetical protein